jgi:GNAT superfamily N-acetyltransferase
VTQNEIGIRAATAADAPALARLRFTFRSEQHSVIESEDEFVARCEPWMRDHLGGGRNDGWRAWLAEQPGPGAFFGTLWLQLVEKLPNPADEAELHAYITSVYVRPEARNAGVGSRLIEAALTTCRDLEVDTVFLWPSARSRALYARHGFTEPSDILSQRLGR